MIIIVQLQKFWQRPSCPHRFANKNVGDGGSLNWTISRESVTRRLGNHVMGVSNICWIVELRYRNVYSRSFRNGLKWKFVVNDVKWLKTHRWPILVLRHKTKMILKLRKTVYIPIYSIALKFKTLMILFIKRSKVCFVASKQAFDLIWYCNDSWFLHFSTTICCCAFICCLYLYLRLTTYVKRKRGWLSLRCLRRP